MKIRRLRSCRLTLLAVLAFVLLLGLSWKDSLAYFTTFATAEGGYELSLGWQTELEETYDNNQKNIQIRNTGELECYVRVKVFAAEAVNVNVSGDGRWIHGAEDYWYYGEPLPAGETTQELIAKIGPVDKEVIKADFDVIVIQECAPVLYEEDGTLIECTDSRVWSQKIEREGA